jgi:hypothetical protein
MFRILGINGTWPSPFFDKYHVTGIVDLNKYDLSSHSQKILLNGIFWL